MAEQLRNPSEAISHTHREYEAAAFNKVAPIAAGVLATNGAVSGLLVSGRANLGSISGGVKLASSTITLHDSTDIATPNNPIIVLGTAAAVLDFDLGGLEITSGLVAVADSAGGAAERGPFYIDYVDATPRADDLQIDPSGRYANGQRMPYAPIGGRQWAYMASAGSNPTKAVYAPPAPTYPDGSAIPATYTDNGGTVQIARTSDTVFTITDTTLTDKSGLFVAGARVRYRGATSSWTGTIVSATFVASTGVYTVTLSESVVVSGATGTTGDALWVLPASTMAAYLHGVLIGAGASSAIHLTLYDHPTHAQNPIKMIPDDAQRGFVKIGRECIGGIFMKGTSTGTHPAVTAIYHVYSNT